eukprot:206676_1
MSTKPPTSNPTPRPTNPDTSTCGDRVTGTYHGFPVTFVVDLPFEGDLEFNAASSSFDVTGIEAFTNLNVPLGTDTDHNELVTLYAMPPGYYKFMIMGHGASSGLFDVLITCTSPDPTAFPTVNPTLIPTALPTRRPTSATSNPTKRATANPTKTPTPMSTKPPTSNPTPRPTNPDTSTCGDRVTGTYHGFPVTFVVDLPFEGDLEFNAASSSFDVTGIEAFTNLNVPLGTDTDHNELVTLYAMPPGYYKFMIMGHGASSGLFDVLITCTSPDPTAFPTVNPTLIPTALPTRRPTTPSPTQPGALECGQSALGTYSGSPVLFTIAIPYDGDLIFDATLSTFPITHIEVYTRLGALVDSHDA